LFLLTGSLTKKGTGSPLEDEKIALLESHLQLMRQLISVYKEGGWGGTKRFGSQLKNFKIQPLTKSF